MACFLQSHAHPQTHHTVETSHNNQIQGLAQNLSHNDIFHPVPIPTGRRQVVLPKQFTADGFRFVGLPVLEHLLVDLLTYKQL